MSLSNISVVCNSHVYVCMNNTTKRYKDVENLDDYIVMNFYVQGQNIFITVERK